MDVVALVALIGSLPCELTCGHIFCCWCREGKHKKPCDPLTGRPASTRNKRTFNRFESALRVISMALYNREWAGIGRLCDYDDDGILFLDIDNCIAEDGSLIPFAANLIRSFGSYFERSPSRKGLRFAFKALLPISLNNRGSIKLWPKGTVPDHPDVEVQLFIRRHYVTLTGDRISDERGVIPAQSFLDNLIAESWWYSQKKPQSPQRLQCSGAERAEHIAAPDDVNDGVLAFDPTRANHKRVKQLLAHFLKNRIFNHDWNRKGRPGTTDSEFQCSVFTFFYVNRQPPIHDLAYLVYLWCAKHGVQFKPHRVRSWLRTAKEAFDRSGRISYKDWEAYRQRNYRLRAKNTTTTPKPVKISDNEESGSSSIFRRHRGLGKRLGEVMGMRSQGFTVLQIAETLGISARAVYKHCSKSCWGVPQVEVPADTSHSDCAQAEEIVETTPNETSHIKRDSISPFIGKIETAIYNGLCNRNVSRSACSKSAAALVECSENLQYEGRLLRLVRQACRMERSVKDATRLVIDALTSDKRLEFPKVKVYADLFRSRGSISGKLAGKGSVRIQFSPTESVRHACKLIAFAEANGMRECTLVDVGSIWRRFWAAQGIDLGNNIQMLSPMGKQLQELAADDNLAIQPRAANGASDKAERFALQLHRQDLPTEQMLHRAVLLAKNQTQKSLAEFLMHEMANQVCENDPAISRLADMIQWYGLPGCYRLDRDGTKIPNRFGRPKAVRIASEIMASARTWAYGDDYVESAERIWQLGKEYDSLQKAVDFIGTQESIYGPPTSGGRSNRLTDHRLEERAEDVPLAIGRK